MNATEFKNELDKMGKLFKLFEKAQEVADVLVNAEQVRSEVDAATAKMKKDQVKLVKSLEDAQKAVDDAKAEAEKIVAEAKDAAATVIADATKQVAETDADIKKDVAKAKDDLAKAKKQHADLLTKIADDQKEYAKLQEALEEIRAKIKGI